MSEKFKGLLLDLESLLTNDSKDSFFQVKLSKWMKNSLSLYV